MSATTIDDWRAAARVADNRPEIGVHIVNYGILKDGVSIEVTELARHECARCDQAIPTTNPGPVDAIDARTGEAQGTWSHQHGCGKWNTPQSVRRTVDLDDLDPDEDDVEDIVNEMMSAMVAEVDAKVADEREEIRQQIIKDLKAEMREVLQLLAGGTDEHQVLVRDGTPGVCRELGTRRLLGWAPLYGDPDGVFVYEEDL